MQKEKTAQEIINEQMKKLPKEVREAIISLDYDKKLEEITKNQKLLIDQAAKLETETSLVLLGLEPLSDYADNLEKNLEIPNERAIEIALAVDESIFKTIRESLKKMDLEMLTKGVGDDNLGIATEGAGTTPTITINAEKPLSREQILNEIENPATIAGGKVNIQPKTANLPEIPPKAELEIKPVQEIEIMPERNVANISTNVLEAKMTAPTIITQQTVSNEPPSKIPEVKEKSTYKADPYKEPLS